MRRIGVIVHSALVKTRLVWSSLPHSMGGCLSCSHYVCLSIDLQVHNRNVFICRPEALLPFAPVAVNWLNRLSASAVRVCVRACVRAWMGLLHGTIGGFTQGTCPRGWVVRTHCDRACLLSLASALAGLFACNRQTHAKLSACHLNLT